MDESVLHNMSAPPRSQIVIAPNKTPPAQVLFSLSSIPTKGSYFIDILSHMYGFEGQEELIAADARLHDTLQITPIMTTMSGTENVVAAENPLFIIYILARTTGTLFMKRRKPDFSYERMSQQVRLPQHGFEHYLYGDTLCLP